MVEYIEREAFLSALDRVINYFVEKEGADPAKDISIRHIQVVRDFAKEFSAADVVEVVHGEWIFKWDAEKDPKRLFVRIVCSKCNLHTGQRSNYCPNCGAKMDGGNHEQET